MVATCNHVALPVTRIPADAVRKNSGTAPNLRGTDFSQLNRGEPEKQYRNRTFCAYKPLREVSESLMVGGYSAFENPTGLYYREGEKITITLRDAPESEVRLIVRDFREGGGEDTYALTKGRNDIVVKRSGLGYIDYRHSKGAAAAPIRVHLVGGQINGVFTRHDDADTWRRLLATAPAGILDILGERCQLAYDIEGLRSGNPDRGPEMLELYDRIVELKQEIMGWEREGLHPGNHILCRVMWGGFMHADGLGAVFNYKTIPGLCNPDGLRGSAWAVAHELGHINQLKPGFCWAGMQEVSNNVFSAWCNYKLRPEDLRLEHEHCTNFDGEGMRGGRFDCYVNNAIVRRQLWQFQGGPDSGVGRVPTARTGDHFVTLCPLWQLQLYFHEVLGQEDFFPRIYQSLRAAGREARPHGQMRADFCRYAGEAAQCNLGPFFLQTGMLALMNRWVVDYSSHMVSINEETIEATLRALERYPEAASSVIHYLTANSVGIYREKRAVVPSDDFRPTIPEKGGRIIFPAEKWKNAVAFEVYKGGQLIRVCLRGLGMDDDASTLVICPPGATSIRAVQWDGTRHMVSGGQPE